MNENGNTLSKKTLISYGLGDFGNNFCWTFVGSFLLYFYTDVFGIAIGAVSFLMFISRFWDAINDPIIGSLSDRTKSRWGKYRPWLLFATPICAIVLVLTFWAHPDKSETWKIVYMYITYCLLVLLYTCVNIPYGTLSNVLSQDIVERGKISSYRLSFALFGIYMIATITIPLTGIFGGGDSVKGFVWVAVLYAAVFICMQMICFKNTREVVELPKAEKLPLSVSLKSVLKNKPFIIAILAQTVYGFTVYGRGAVMMYYFKYVCGAENLYSVFNLVIWFPQVIGAACFALLFKKIPNKGKCTAAAAVVYTVGTGLMWFCDPVTSAVPFYALAVITGFAGGTIATGVYAMIPDTTEYGQWKTGIRNDGFMYAFVSLGNKIGQAIGTSLMPAILGVLGYVANQAQTPAVLTALKAMFSLVPAAFWVIIVVMLLFYNLDEKFYNRILDDLAHNTHPAAKAQKD